MIRPRVFTSPVFQSFRKQRWIANTSALPRVLAVWSCARGKSVSSHNPPLRRDLWSSEYLCTVSLRPGDFSSRRGHSTAANGPGDPDSSDPYAVLGVEQACTDADLKRAYLRSAKAFHPDMNPGDLTAKQRFQRVSQAYELLKDPHRRAQYDSSGSDAAWQGGQSARDADSQADETFRNAAQDGEIILEAMKLYVETVGEEALLAVDLVRQGRWREAMPLVQEHRGLFAGIAFVALLLRHPAAIAAALRFGVVVLMQPPVFRMIMQLGFSKQVWAYAWFRIVSAARRQRARLQQRGRDRSSAATTTETPPRSSQRSQASQPYERTQPHSTSAPPQEAPDPQQPQKSISGVRTRKWK